jgi:hypothetical protein
LFYRTETTNEYCNDIYNSHLEISRLAKEANVPIIYLGIYQFKETITKIFAGKLKLINDKIGAKYVEIGI